jgi:hypothetical protein
MKGTDMPEQGTVLEGMVAETLHEWAQDSPVPTPGLADRVLRARPRYRRRRAGSLVAAVATAAALVAGAVIVPQLLDGSGATPAGAGGRDVLADLENELPKSMVAARDLAISAYWVDTTPEKAKRGDNRSRTWYLLNPEARTYSKTSWAWVDVAPGLRRAAVLEGPLPTKTVKIIDTTTGKTTKEIQLANAAGGLDWSKDGSKLLVTNYDGPTDEIEDFTAPKSYRTGFTLIDWRSGEPGTPKFHAVPARDDNSSRVDFRWHYNEDLLRTMRTPGEKSSADYYYDLEGRQVTDPPNPTNPGYEDAGISPDGRLLAGEKVSAKDMKRPDFKSKKEEAAYFKKLAEEQKAVVNETATGKNVATFRLPVVMTLQAWADNKHLIALGCGSANCKGKVNEFNNRYVLIGLDGKVTPLTAERKDTRKANSWEPEFSTR